MAKFVEGDYTFKAEFDEQEFPARFGPDALLVFFLSLFLKRDNVTELANDAITDGNNDKKLDVCFVDIDQGRAIIAQGYTAKEWGRPAALANKAADLNTAFSWLFAGDLDKIPERIRVKANELREALKRGEIERIDVFYVHNCFASQNVQTELATVASSVLAHLHELHCDSVTVSAREYDLDEIEDLYRARDRDILVEDELDVKGKVLGRIQGDGWEAAVCTVEATWLFDLYKKHSNHLFSANLREFLGTTRHKGNINAAIQKTAAASPGRFWVYNNGITALTQELIFTDEDGLRVKGLSIINGAQTTGALGECTREAVSDVRVLCRFVEAETRTVIEDIVRYNNTQNIIRPSDLRSNDAVQKRLADELASLRITYIHRRSGRIPKNAILAEEIAPILCAFHGDLQTAGRNRRDIFESNTTYERVFSPDVSGEHLFLIWSLANAIDSLKKDLKLKIGSEDARELEEQRYEVLKYSTSKYFVLFVVGACVEEILGRRIPNRYGWKCKRALVMPDGAEIQTCWVRAVACILPFVTNEVGKVGKAYDVTRSSEMAAQVAKGVRATLDGFAEQTQKEFKAIKDASLI
jgi:hypothetical protein